MAKTKHKTGTGESGEMVFTRIIEQTKWRTRQDIDSWRGAIMAAENILYPQRVHLYNLYDEVILDAHVAALIGQRINKLLSQDFRLVNKEGKDIPEAKKLFDTCWFYKFMELAIESRWWGHSLIQLWDVQPGKGYGTVMLVPRRHVIPELGGVSVLQGDTLNLIPYREKPWTDWLVEVGDQREHGLFKSAAPAFLFKKNALLQWSQYTEVFGMPVGVGKTASRNQADMQRMADNLKRMGSAAFGVFQEGESIEFIESTKGDAFNVYDKLVERSNSELTKLFLQQLMTMEDGSSRAQGEVHERVMDNVGEADKRMIKFIVNDQLIPRMIAHGFTELKEVKGLEWSHSPDTDSTWKKALELMPYYQIDKAWIEEKFGIPISNKIHNE